MYISIIDYMDAAKRLIYGAENNFVYNPSALEETLKNADYKLTTTTHILVKDYWQKVKEHSAEEDVFVFFNDLFAMILNTADGTRTATEVNELKEEKMVLQNES